MNAAELDAESRFVLLQMVDFHKSPEINEENSKIKWAFTRMPIHWSNQEPNLTRIN